MNNLINSLFYLLIIIGIVVLAFCGIINSRKTKKPFLNMQTTDSVKGFAITIIIFAHIMQEYGQEFILFKADGLWRYITIACSVWGGVGVSLFFVLSGYGNSISAWKHKNNWHEMMKWLLKRIFRMIFSFIICFAIVWVTLKVFGVNDYSRKMTLTDFVHFRIPYCSTWYLKIQILAYLIIAVSVFLLSFYKSSEKRIVLFYLVLILIFSMGYFFVATITLKLDNYWWMTFLCVWGGCLLFSMKDVGISLTDRNKKQFRLRIVLGLSLFLSICSYGYICMVWEYSFVHMLSYLAIGTCGCLIIELLGGFSSETFAFLGKRSLELCLVHIGTLRILRGGLLSSFDYNIVPICTYVGVSIVFACVANKICDIVTSRINEVLGVK